MNIYPFHRSLIITLVSIYIMAGAVLWLFPKIITGDFADVAVTQITTTPGGQVTLSYSTVSSHGTTVVNAFYAGSKYQGGGSGTGGGILGRPGQGSSVVCFNLNPERTPATGSFENSPMAGRLLIHEGTRKTLHAGERLYFHDFQTPDGVRHYGYIEVESSRR